MESSILKTVGQVAGIGGIALGVLLLVFRDVVRKNIFPRLSSVHAYRIIRMIVVATFLIAALGIGAWTFVQTQEKSGNGHGNGYMPAVTEREKAAAEAFWKAAWAGSWKTAYDLFPAVLHGQMAFPKFVEASSHALNQFPDAPLSREFESAQPISGTLLVTSLARFDEVSVFRELLTFQIEEGQWVPWTFVTLPVEWPLANEYVSITQRPSELLAAAKRESESDRGRVMAERFGGKYVGPQTANAWPLRVDAIGLRVGKHTCDVETMDESEEGHRVTLLKVLGGCVLQAGTNIAVVGRIESVSDTAIQMSFVRFWK